MFFIIILNPIYLTLGLSCIADYVSSNDYLRCVRVDCNNIIDAEGNSDCTPDSGDDGGGASCESHCYTLQHETKCVTNIT